MSRTVTDEDIMNLLQSQYNVQKYFISVGRGYDNSRNYTEDNQYTEALKQLVIKLGVPYEIYDGQFIPYIDTFIQKEYGLTGGTSQVGFINYKDWQQVWSERYMNDFQRYIKDTFTVTPFCKNRPGGCSSGGILDSVWNGIVQFLNPISGGLALEQQFSKSPSTIIKQQASNLLDPPTLNPLTESISGILNVAGSVGIGLGLQGGVNAIQGYSSATAALPANVQGPINPGFWSTLSSGNITGAIDILTAPISSAFHSPTIADSKLASGATSLATAQTGSVIFGVIDDLFGKVGRAIALALSGNFEGAIQTIVKPPIPPPGTTPIIPTSSFVSGSGGGFGGSGGSAYAKTLETSSNSMILIVIIIVSLLVFVLILSKKGK